MHTPSDAGWLGRNFRRALLIIHPTVCALYVLSWNQSALPYDWTPGWTVAGIVFIALGLAIPVAVVSGTFLIVIATLTGLLPRTGLPLLCASVTAGGVLILALMADPTDVATPLALWCFVASVLTLGLWSEFDGGG